jgi:aldehyde dehydrogenase (NAD+)
MAQRAIETIEPASSKDKAARGPGARELLFGSLWEYAPAPESRSAVKIAPRYGHFIGGEFTDGGAPLAVENPATEEQLSEILIGGPDEVDRAVRAARRALPAWRALAPARRAECLYHVGRMIQERSRELAVLETLDNGKPIKETRDVDVPLAAAHFLYHAGWADKLEYAFPGASIAPLGVCAQVIPWNFPLLMAAWKIAPALACGNTVVLKPAETTPLSAAFLAQICAEAGVPPGVVNVVNGDGETGRALVSHPDVDKVAFTGSTEVGREIRKVLAGTRKRLTLELGGKGANIVFEDAALDQAVEGIVNGIWFNQGQVCCAGSRLLVQESIEKTLLEKLRRRLATLRVGDPLDKNTDLGAIVSGAQKERILDYVRIGREEGAQMHQLACVLPARGHFVAPTFFTGVAQSHRIAQEEIFGPVLCVQTFRTPDEALAIANNTPYGLSAGVWSDKGSKVFAMTRGLRAGVVWGNTFNQFDPASPFGGYKESGFGREGGRHGLLAYLDVRAASEARS